MRFNLILSATGKQNAVLVMILIKRYTTILLLVKDNFMVSNVLETLGYFGFKKTLGSIEQAKGINAESLI